MFTSLPSLHRLAAAAVLALTCATSHTATWATPTTPSLHVTDAAPHPMTGVWQFEGDEGLQPRWLVIDAKGRYVHAEVGASDNVGRTGMEAGQLPWPGASARLPAYVRVDTNGQWGLSHPQAQQWLWAVEDDGQRAQLRIRTGDAAAPERLLRRLDTPHARAQTQGTAVGAWQHPDGHVLIIGSHRTWVWIDNTHREHTEPRPSAPLGCQPQAGVEYGSYFLEGHALRVGLAFVDTNGCGGLHNVNAASQAPWQIHLQGDTLQLQAPGRAPLTLQRIR